MTQVYAEFGQDFPKELNLKEMLSDELKQNLQMHCKNYDLEYESQESILALLNYMVRCDWHPKPQNELRVLSIGSQCLDYFPLKMLYEKQNINLHFTSLDTAFHIEMSKKKFSDSPEIQYLEWNDTLKKIIDEQKILKRISNIDFIIFNMKIFPGDEEMTYFFEHLIDFVRPKAKIVFTGSPDVMEKLYSCFYASPWYTEHAHDNEKSLGISPDNYTEDRQIMLARHFIFHCLSRDHAFVWENMRYKFQQRLTEFLMEAEANDAKWMNVLKQARIKKELFVNAPNQYNFRMKEFIVDKTRWADLLKNKTHLQEGTDYEFISAQGPRCDGFYLKFTVNQDSLKRLNKLDFEITLKNNCSIRG